MSSSNEVVRLGIVAIAVNVVLMLVKVSVGWLGNSYALIADGIESAGDIFTSLVTWMGFRMSLRPPDETHPFGHGKIETLAGMFSGLALLGAAGGIAWLAIIEIRTPHHAPAWFTLPVLILVVVVKEILSRRVLAAGDELDSQALRGDAWHHRSDAITSAAAALGISIALIGGPGYEAADDWGALAACVIIVINGLRILQTALHEVLDGSVSYRYDAQVASTARTVQGVENIEKCRARKSGIGFFVELHVGVDPHMTVEEGHRVGHRVKDALIDNAALRIIDVVIHLEPATNQRVSIVHVVR